MSVTQFLPALCRVRVIKQDKMLTLKGRKYKSKLSSRIFSSAGKQFLVLYYRSTAMKNKKLRNVFWNYVVTDTTKLLIPLKLVMKRVLAFCRLPVLDFPDLVQCSPAGCCYINFQKENYIFENSIPGLSVQTQLHIRKRWAITLCRWRWGIGYTHGSW